MGFIGINKTTNKEGKFCNQVASKYRLFEWYINTVTDIFSVNRNMIKYGKPTICATLKGLLPLHPLGSLHP